MKEKILEVVYNSTDELNHQLGKEDKLVKSLDTRLFGGDSKLDSLGLVNILVIIEQNIEDEFDVSITMADEKAMSQKRSPFLTIETLVDYIVMLLREKNDE